VLAPGGKNTLAVAVATVFASLVLTACSSTAGPTGTMSSPTPTFVPDQHTANDLIRVAQVFNDQFGRNDVGPVYDRWDVRSQAIISRSEYVRRHLECTTAPQAPAHVQTARPGAAGAWLVRYQIGDLEFTDYWFFVNRRWVFDLVMSNPDAVRLYRLSGADYATAVGCAGK
jgi:hypothetical protein